MSAIFPINANLQLIGLPSDTLQPNKWKQPIISICNQLCLTVSFDISGNRALSQSCVSLFKPSIFPATSTSMQSSGVSSSTLPTFFTY